MLVNAYTEPARVRTVEGTRMLREDFGIIGSEVYDPKEPLRRWFIQALYAPIPGRTLGGLRAKLEDDKGFTSFINQRDLEVSLGMAAPGKWCIWAGHRYVDPDDPDWYGICLDDDDLLDDLQERELLWRGQSPNWTLYPPLDITRRVHTEAFNDFEETHTLLWDMDVETGYGPDPRRETIESRWKRVERQRLQWERI